MGGPERGSRAHSNYPGDAVDRTTRTADNASGWNRPTVDCEYGSRGSGQIRHQQFAEKSGKEEGKVSRDRKSTRLNSSHQIISYAVFCLKKKKMQELIQQPVNNRNDYSQQKLNLRNR